MTGIPTEDIAIIENTATARDEFGYAWGGGDTIINKKHLEALRSGKCIALYDGEYVTFLSLKKPKSVGS